MTAHNKNWWTEDLAEVCENFQMDISCLVDGELDEVAASRAMLHLENCDDCRAFFDGTRVALRAIDQLVAGPLQRSA